MEPEKTETAAPPDAAKDAVEAPKYITEEQLASAVATRFKAFEQKFDKSFATAFEGFTGKLKTELSALMPPKTEPTPPEPKKKDAPAPVGDTPEFKKLQDQIAELTAKAEKANAERDAERAKSRDSTLRQRVTETLVAAGVDGARARHAVGLLVDSEKRVRWSEDGDALLFKKTEHDEVEIGPGLKEWLKTDDGKFYVPPRNAAGSGDRGGANPPRATGGAPDRTAVAEGLRRALSGGF